MFSHTHLRYVPDCCAPALSFSCWIRPSSRSSTHQRWPPCFPTPWYLSCIPSRLSGRSRRCWSGSIIPTTTGTGGEEATSELTDSSREGKLVVPSRYLASQRMFPSVRSLRTIMRADDNRSGVLIRVATVGYGREPDYEVHAPDEPSQEERMAFELKTSPILREACLKEGIDPDKAPEPSSLRAARRSDGPRGHRRRGVRNKL